MLNKFDCIGELVGHSVRMQNHIDVAHSCAQGCVNAINFNDSGELIVTGSGMFLMFSVLDSRR